ncbi:DIS3 mitotic control [Phytophthora pseudosyringae]|uniref:DIS3 mitotic control n=1 Tax=Phytophthora pseudosyringae TaxID=221518 RepID=A0A8T1WEY3_9STRA|nr:DIS3 mitotic control [Phytophthora pseudosyringae]
MNAPAAAGAPRRQRPQRPMDVDVVVRVRPLLPLEQQQPVAVHITAGTQQKPRTLTLLSPDADPVDFRFEKCYDESVTQRKLFQREVAPAVNALFAGRSSAVVACGATGAGKTFTMEGSEHSVGIIPRCIKRLFRVVEELHYKCEVKVSYVEVAGGNWQDLLATGERKLAILEQIGPVAMKSLTSTQVRNAAEFTELYERGRTARQAGASGLKERPSRGHSILIVHARTEDKASGETRDGKMHWIELAGYESIESQVGYMSSLLELDSVISGRTASKCSAPRRESNLTRVLHDSLSGSSHVIVICNVSPSVYIHQETLQTLNYAHHLQGSSSSVVKVSSTPRKSTHVLDLATLLQKSPITPAEIVDKGDNTHPKRPLPSSEHAHTSPTASKVPKGKKRLLVSPPAQRESSTQDAGTSGKEELTMEDKLKLWKLSKQNKQKTVQNIRSSVGVTKRGSGGNVSSSGAAKRKRIDITAIGCLRKASTSTPEIFRMSAPKKSRVSAEENDRDLLSQPASKSLSKPSFVAQKQSTPKEKDRVDPATINQDSLKKPLKTVLNQNDRDMATSSNQPIPEPKPAASEKSKKPQTVWSLNPAMDKENQTEQSSLINQIAPAPVTTVEKKPELLAKDLIRVAIGFENRHRIATAFSVFKRAHHILPKKSAKLAERLMRLERECPAAVDHVPSQEMSTAAFMVKVLERDLMAVLNHGTTKELTELHAIGGKRAELALGERPFQQLEELQRVPGISANVVARLYDHHTNWGNHQ